jgi:hypothetical protein
MVINGFIFYGYVNINPMHFWEHWNYSGASGRSSTTAFTLMGSARIQDNMKNPLSNDFV